MCSAADVGADPVPHGFTVRRSSGDTSALWHEVVTLPDGRIGVAVGHTDDPDRRDRLRSDLRAGRWGGLDDEEGSRDAAGSPPTIVCGVIDRPASRFSYRAAGADPGAPAPLMAVPDSPPRAMGLPPGRAMTADLPPGSTLLFCTGPADRAAALLAELPSAHPERLADHLVSNLSSRHHPGVIAVLYRHPPLPLSLTLPAVAENLAVVRDRLRSWLALAGVDSEPASDVLLAVGEATSNAAEHSATNGRRSVTLSVHARVSGAGLRLTVSDNGRWRAPPADPGHRGHGLRLIKALVDSAELTTNQHGTTVEMLKELRT